MSMFSAYVPMRDGVRLAVDVTLPGDAPGPLPAVIVFTRYWRGVAWQSPPPEGALGFRESEAFAAEGFAYVSVDCRGSGASFGSRRTEYGRDEVLDYGEILAWAAEQPWCDGRLATTGLSYSGNAAELALLAGDPHLKAAAPRFTDFDWYEHILFPGGARNIAFAPQWAGLIEALDAGDPRPLLEGLPESLPRILGVKPVDGALLGPALAEHAANTRFADLMAACEFRDDVGGNAPANPAELVDRLYARHTPTFHWAGWLDAGTAAGALARFAATDAPMRLCIGPWNHGAGMDCDPLAGAPIPASLSRAEQVRMIAAFFREAMAPDPRIAREIRYYTFGETKWRTAPSWPPAGVRMAAWHLAEGHGLTRDAPIAEAPSDTYSVDGDAGTGASSRWTTSLGGGPVDYGDRAEADKRLLVYTSAPLSSEMRIEGTPRIELWLSCSAPDGLFVAYLEAVAPDGRVAYLSEGELRGVHREAPRAFRRADARPLPVGETVHLEFSLLPLAARLPRGFALRIALAGADKDSFAPVRTPCWQVHRDAARPSRLWLPVQEKDD
ncbi:MAG TPA: CocE/NonD family hydrolase [Rhizomicrobium sp.]